MSSPDENSDSRLPVSMIDRVAAYLRKNGGHVIVELLVNFIPPFIIYDYAEAPSGEVRALLLSSVPPILWSLVARFSRHRTPRRLVVTGGGRHRPVVAGDARRWRGPVSSAAREARHRIDRTGIRRLGADRQAAGL